MEADKSQDLQLESCRPRRTDRVSSSLSPGPKAGEGPAERANAHSLSLDVLFGPSVDQTRPMDTREDGLLYLSTPSNVNLTQKHPSAHPQNHV